MGTKTLKVFAVIAICAGLLGAIVVSRYAEKSDSAPADESIVQNLRAFAKLFGYVRYFHPSDGASAIDWDRFAVLGVTRVVEARDAESLKAILNSLFLPIAPTLQLYLEGESPPDPHPSLMPRDTTDHRPAYWQHLGIALGNPGPYRSIRVNREVPEKPAPSSASFWKRFDASPFRGKDLRLTAVVKSDVRGPGNEARVFLYDELPDFEHHFFDDMRDRPITTKEWADYSISGQVGLESDTIGLGGMLVGTGSVWFDDFRLEARSEGEEVWSTVDLSNTGFEVGPRDGVPEGWRAWAPGYRFRTDLSTSSEGSSSLMLHFADSAPLATPMFDVHPAPGEVFRRSLGGGLAAQIPLALYNVDEGTLVPPGVKPLSTIQSELSQIDLTSLSSATESVRVAAVVILWNVIQHFYPLFDATEADWEDVLSTALVRARQDETAEEFVGTLRWMIAQLNDGHGFVEHPSAGDESRPPILVDEAEHQMVIVAVAPGLNEENCFRPGDHVLAIDGLPTAHALDSAMDQISGSPQWKRQRALRTFGRGPSGTIAELRLLRDGREIRCDVVRSYSRGIWPDRPQSFDEIADGVYYVNLSAAPMEAIEAEMSTLASADAVIFDLRGYTRNNTGVLSHLAYDTLLSTYWPIPQVIYPDRQNLVGYDTTDNRWVLPPKEPRLRGRVVFLADANTISQAESVLEIVEHYRLGEIVGQRTAGVTGNANPFVLPGGYRVSFTGMRVRKLNGELHHGSGIAPTVPVEKTLDGLMSGRDEVLERALRLLQDKQD